MEISAGMIIIGSLLWDKSSERITWRKQLDLDSKINIPLPICYGRKSGKARGGTYTMIFSNNLNESKLGTAIVIPFNKSFTEIDFSSRVYDVSSAEGIDETKTRIFKDWGTVCIAINPAVSEEKRGIIKKRWQDLVASNRASLPRGQTQPNLSEYGVPGEKTSIDNDLYLTIELDSLFKSSLRQFDIVIATSNAIKLNAERTVKYPSIKHIARAIFESGYYDYLILNRFNNIKTYQDKKIMRTLKRRYRVKLSEKKLEVINKHLGS